MYLLYITSFKTNIVEDEAQQFSLFAIFKQQDIVYNIWSLVYHRQRDCKQPCLTSGAPKSKNASHPSEIPVRYVEEDACTLILT